jgi:hypothetical protein
MDSDELERIDGELGDILKSAGRITNDDQAYAVLAGLVATTTRINGVISSASGQAGAVRSLTAPPQASPDAIARLQGWLQKIKSALEALAAFLDAASYSVGVSVPWGLSVQITFNV